MNTGARMADLQRFRRRLIGGRAAHRVFAGRGILVDGATGEQRERRSRRNKGENAGVHNSSVLDLPGIVAWSWPDIRYGEVMR